MFRWVTVATGHPSTHASPASWRFFLLDAEGTAWAERWRRVQLLHQSERFTHSSVLLFLPTASTLSRPTSLLTCSSAPAPGSKRNSLFFPSSSSAPSVTFSFLSSFLHPVFPFLSSSPSLHLPSGQLRVVTGSLPRFSPTRFLPNCQRLPRQPGQLYGRRLRGNRPLPLSPPAAALASLVAVLPPLSSSFPVSPGQVITAGNQKFDSAFRIKFIFISTFGSAAEHRSTVRFPLCFRAFWGFGAGTCGPRAFFQPPLPPGILHTPPQRPRKHVQRCRHLPKRGCGQPTA